MFLGGRYLSTDGMVVVCCGDSITDEGRGIPINGNANPEDGYPDILSTRSEMAGVVIHNTAVGGSGIDGMINRGGTIDSYLGNGANVCLAWGGTNDIFGNASAATCLSRMRTFCNARRASGWDYIIVFTTLQRERLSGSSGSAITTAKLPIIREYNYLLFEHWREFCDLVFDVRQIPQLQPIDETYMPDRVHPNALGHGLIVDRLVPILQRLPNRSGVGFVASPDPEPTDSTTPGLVSVQIDGGQLDNILITFDEELNPNAVPPVSAFALNLKTVTAVNVSGLVATLTVDSEYAPGDDDSLAYIKPGSNALQDAAGNEVDSFSGQAISLPETQVSIRVEFEDMSLEGFDIVTGTQFSGLPYSGSGFIRGTRAADGVTRSTASHTFAGETGYYDIAVHYFDEWDGSANAWVYVAGVEVDAWSWTASSGDTDTAQTRTISSVLINNGDLIEFQGAREGGENLRSDYMEYTLVAPFDDVISPTIDSSDIDVTNPTNIRLTFNESLDDSFVPATSAFTIGTKTATAVSISGEVATVTVDSAYNAGDDDTIAYNEPASNGLRDLNGNLVASFGAQAISMPEAVGSVTDLDVLAFKDVIDANGEDVTTAEYERLQTLVSSLKSNGVWTKTLCLWAPVGGSLTTATRAIKHKNGVGTILTPANFNEADWNRSVGLDGRAKNNRSLNTFINDSTDTQQDSIHLCVIVEPPVPSAQNRDVGPIGKNKAQLITYYNGESFFRAYNSTIGLEGVTPTAADGVFMGNRLGSDAQILLDGVVQASVAGLGFTTNGDNSNFVFYRARDDQAEKIFSGGSIGLGLTLTEAQDFGAAMKTFREAR